MTELDKLRKELHARAPGHLPMLDDIRVASPCHERWDAMTGDEQARHCGSCKKNVYNLSAMTREVAEALVREKEGKLCVRYYRRADGTILTADCSVGVRRKRVQLVAAAAAMTALAAGAAAAVFAGMGAPPVVRALPAPRGRRVDHSCDGRRGCAGDADDAADGAADASADGPSDDASVTQTPYASGTRASPPVGDPSLRQVLSVGSTGVPRNAPAPLALTSLPTQRPVDMAWSMAPRLPRVDRAVRVDEAEPRRPRAPR